MKSALHSAENANGEIYHLRIYVAGQTAKPMIALTNLKRICETHLTDKYTLEVVDLAKNPNLAMVDNILALPSLVRRLPEPIKKSSGIYPMKSGCWSDLICKRLKPIKKD